MRQNYEKNFISETRVEAEKPCKEIASCERFENVQGRKVRVKRKTLKRRKVSSFKHLNHLSLRWKLSIALCQHGFFFLRFSSFRKSLLGAFHSFVHFPSAIDHIKVLSSVILSVLCASKYHTMFSFLCQACVRSNAKENLCVIFIFQRRKSIVFLSAFTLSPAAQKFEYFTFLHHFNARVYKIETS